MLGVKLLFLAATAAAALSTPDPFVGRWKMNPAKSNYLMGAAPLEQIATMTVKNGDLHVLVNAITSDGIKTVVSYSVPYDGGVGKMDADSSPTYNGITGRHIGYGEREISRLKDGKVLFTARTVLAPDGKSMTVYSEGVSPAEYGRKQAFQVHSALKARGPVTVPREFVFMDRAAIGLGGVFLHLDAELNFHRLFEQEIEDFSVERVAREQEAALAVVGLQTS